MNSSRTCWKNSDVRFVEHFSQKYGKFIFWCVVELSLIVLYILARALQRIIAPSRLFFSSQYRYLLRGLFTETKLRAHPFFSIHFLTLQNYISCCKLMRVETNERIFSLRPYYATDKKLLTCLPRMMEMQIFTNSYTVKCKMQWKRRKKKKQAIGNEV